MQDIYGKTLLHWALSVASVNCLIEYYGVDSAMSGDAIDLGVPNHLDCSNEWRQNERENNMNMALIIWNQTQSLVLQAFQLSHGKIISLQFDHTREECRNPWPERVSSSGQSDCSRYLQLHTSNLKAFCGASKIRNVSMEPSQGLS